MPAHGAWFLDGLMMSLRMAWATLWALVLGYALSGILQVFVPKDRMVAAFGKPTFKAVSLATLFGAASSSCSYAAAAAGRSAFKKGSSFIPVVAFMFASTNIVIELGAVIARLLGWRFVLGEVVGAIVLIAVVWLLLRLTFSKRAEDAARVFAAKSSGGHDHSYMIEGASFKEQVRNPSNWGQVGSAFAMDWSMAWREVTVGFLLAGFIGALVPTTFWHSLFMTTGPAPIRLVENAVVGPIVAMLSSVCSIGNVPFAAVLWSGGIGFGGVMAFIYGDLLTLPLIFLYKRYYGWRGTLHLGAAMFVAMVVAGIVVELLFSALGLAPQAGNALPQVAEAGFAFDGTAILNLIALIAAAGLFVAKKRFAGHTGHYCHEGSHAHG